MVVPIRRFDDAKSRLAEVLSPAERRQLAVSCARAVIASIPDANVFVVCDDDEVARFAGDLGATAVLVDVVGLNESLVAAMPTVRSDRPRQPVLVAHADLAFGARLADFWDDVADTLTSRSFVIVPDEARDGSNVVVIGADVLSEWRFLYGNRSFDAHVDLARNLGLDVRIVEHDLLSLDLDTAHDLRHPRVTQELERLLPGWNRP
jgi:2-phospho-L-lactate guanylyltransferase